MFRNPFDWLPPQLLEYTHHDGGLIEALVAVPISLSLEGQQFAAPVRVVVVAGDGPRDWLARAATAAVVIVAATKARLTAEEGDPA